MAEHKAPVYDAAGTRKGEVLLEPAVFGIEPNVAVMHQVVTAQMAGARSGSASTKTRAEVRGGGVKPWRQKGTGRARQGSIRAPQWRGGGIVHGPRPRSYEQRTPKKMKKLALRSALSARAAENAIRVIEAIYAEKTKQAKALLMATEANGKVVLVLAGADIGAERAFRNLPQVLISDPGHLTTYDVLWSDVVIFTSDTLSAISAGAFEVTASDFVKEDDPR